MIVSVVILTVSAALFLYWFRYVCALILSTRTVRDFSEQIAAQNQLQFAEIQQRLAHASTADLESIYSALERDYEAVNRLLEKAGGLQVGGDSLEETMLRIDFRIMQVVYAVSRWFSVSRARAALEEMSEIVAHFADACGERAAEVRSA